MRFVDCCVCVCGIICLSARCSSLSSMKSHVFHDTQIPFLSHSFSLALNRRENVWKKRSHKNSRSKKPTFKFSSNLHSMWLSGVIVCFCTSTLDCNSLSSGSIVLGDVGVVDVNNLSCLRCTWKVFVPPSAMQLVFPFNRSMCLQMWPIPQSIHHYLLSRKFSRQSHNEIRIVSAPRFSSSSHCYSSPIFHYSAKTCYHLWHIDFIFSTQALETIQAGRLLLLCVCWCFSTFLQKKA